jgi:hypothetical protein
MNTAWQKRKAAEVNSSDLRHIVVAHSGQSSQLFSVTTGRNAQFLATAARGGLAIKGILSGFNLTIQMRVLRETIPCCSKDSRTREFEQF